MKNDRSKRVFIVALTLIFCVLFLLCGDRKTVRDMYDYNYLQKMENNSVYIERRDGDSLFVGGSGKLSGADLQHLMSTDGIKTTDVTDMDIGDGITEVGYSVANGYMYLEALRLGNGVGLIHNGAVKNCTSLQYVYLPRGLEEVGQDFMYNCNDAYVVTDGTLEELPEMPNVPKKRVLSEVHSFEDFVRKRSDVAVKNFPAAKLTGDDSEPDADPTILNPGCKKASPSFALPAGSYEIKIVGDALDKLTKDDVHITIKDKDYEKLTVETERDVLICRITLENRAKSTVFQVVNHSDDAVRISELRICDTGFVIPEAVKTWWQ